MLTSKNNVNRYADYFIVFERSRLLIVKQGISEFFKERGVWLSEEKTRIINFQNEYLKFIGIFRKYWKPKYGFVKDHIGEKGIAMYPERTKVKEVIKN